MRATREAPGSFCRSVKMPISLTADDGSDKAKAAADEFAQQLGEVYKHECHENKKKECKLPILVELYVEGLGWTSMQ